MGLWHLVVFKINVQTVPVYTVNVPLRCRQDCLYIITENRQVSTALYLLGLLLYQVPNNMMHCTFEYLLGFH